MTLAIVRHFWKNIRGISDLNEGCKTRLGNRIPQESSRGLGNRNLGYSFTTERVKSIFPAMMKVLQPLFPAFSRSNGRRRITWTLRLLTFYWEESPGSFSISASESLSRTEATLVILTERF